MTSIASQMRAMCLALVAVLGLFIDRTSMNNSDYYNIAICGFLFLIAWVLGDIGEKFINEK